MGNSLISVNVLVKQKVTSKYLIIYLVFLIYISSFFLKYFQLLKLFTHNIGTFEAPLSLVCKPNVRETFETFENILKQSVYFLKMKGLKMKCKVLVSLCSFCCTTIFFHVHCGPVFDATFHHVTQPFWNGKTYCENTVFCVYV